MARALRSRMYSASSMRSDRTWKRLSIGAATIAASANDMA